MLSQDIALNPELDMYLFTDQVGCGDSCDSLVHVACDSVLYSL